ncbi:MAG: Rid family detoxifying hydrolase [Myxococcales bacterium]|nr:Rid family detoxifying hydrolase [Myxococcales bacterium]MCB9626303.1 reactive intermediate/imine deaminase [Sandaracinaceae bacterium]
MTLDAIATPGAPAAIGPYSQAIAAGGFLFVSGQLPMDPVTGELILDDTTAATHRVMDNLVAILEAAGTDLSRAVKATVYCTDLADYAAINAVYATYFEGRVPPARVAVQVAALPKGAKVEIELVALLR